MDQFIRWPTTGLWVYLRSLGSFGGCLGVVRFIERCLVHSGGAKGSSALLTVARFIRRAPRGRRVHLEFLSSLRGALGLSDSFEFAPFIRVASSGRLIHSESLG